MPGALLLAGDRAAGGAASCGTAGLTGVDVADGGAGIVSPKWKEGLAPSNREVGRGAISGRAAAAAIASGDGASGRRTWRADEVAVSSVIGWRSSKFGCAASSGGTDGWGDAWASVPRPPGAAGGDAGAGCGPRRPDTAVKVSTASAGERGGCGGGATRGGGRESTGVGGTGVQVVSVATATVEGGDGCCFCACEAGTAAAGPSDGVALVVLVGGGQSALRVLGVAPFSTAAAMASACSGDDEGGAGGEARRAREDGGVAVAADGSGTVEIPADEGIAGTACAGDGGGTTGGGSASARATSSTAGSDGLPGTERPMTGDAHKGANSDSGSGGGNMLVTDGMRGGGMLMRCRASSTVAAAAARAAAVVGDTGETGEETCKPVPAAPGLCEGSVARPRNGEAAGERSVAPIPVGAVANVDTADRAESGEAAGGDEGIDELPLSCCGHE